MTRRWAFAILLILLSAVGVNHHADLAARQRSSDRTPPPVTQPGPGSTDASAGRPFCPSSG
jgi:hypothetical protein